MSVTIDGILWPPTAAQVGNIIATFSNSAVQYAALNVNVTSTSANSNSALAMITLNGNTVFFMNAHPYESAKSSDASKGANNTVQVVFGADRLYPDAWGSPGVEGQYSRATYQFHTSTYAGQGLSLHAWNTWREGGGWDLEMIKSNSSTVGVLSPVDANTELGFISGGGVAYYDGFGSSENIAVQAAGISFESSLSPVSNAIYTNGYPAYMPTLPGKIRFLTANNSEPYMAERMMIDANGNIFIRNGSLYVENGNVSISGKTAITDVTANTTRSSPGNTQTFTANGTWTKPSTNETYARIQLWGAGGAGGRGGTSVFGGGGGEYFECIVTMTILGATEQVIVGRGGKGRTTNGDGNNGTSTIFANGTLNITADFGNGGSSTQALSAGGVTSVQTRANTNSAFTMVSYPQLENGGGGRDTSDGVSTYFSGAGGGGSSGGNYNGGKSWYGGNGGAGKTTGGGSGGNGSEPGGGGGASNNGATSGDGANGKVIITTFNSF